MKKLLSITTVLVGTLILASQIWDQRATLQVSAADVFAVDGDTLAHGDDRYRLIGFDTPETYRPQCAAEKALGLKAKARLTELIATEGQIKLVIEPDLDVHDRLLAVGRVAGQDVGTILTSEGLARSYSGGKRQSWCN